jgi:hypothetical protein
MRCSGRSGACALPANADIGPPSPSRSGKTPHSTRTCPRRPRTRPGLPVRSAPNADPGAGVAAAATGSTFQRPPCRAAARRDSITRSLNDWTISVATPHSTGGRGPGPASRAGAVAGGDRRGEAIDRPRPGAAAGTGAGSSFAGSDRSGVELRVPGHYRRAGGRAARHSRRLPVWPFHRPAVRGRSGRAASSPGVAGAAGYARPQQVSVVAWRTEARAAAGGSPAPRGATGAPAPAPDRRRTRTRPGPAGQVRPHCGSGRWRRGGGDRLHLPTPTLPRRGPQRFNHPIIE